MTAPEVLPSWDRPLPYVGDPTLAYVICAVPRAGSTMLAEALRCTGQLGAPTEYLNRSVVATPLRARWRCRTWHEYFRSLFCYRTTGNGVFGFKTHWNDLVDLAADVTGTCDPDVHDVRRTIENLVPGLRYLRIVRVNQDRSAVSWWIANHTGEWRRILDQRADSGTRPQYDRRALDAAAAHLDALTTGWDAFFHAGRIQPVTVTYEELVENHAGTVAAVAAALGVAIDPTTVPLPLTARQGDEFTEEILVRWSADRTTDA